MKDWSQLTADEKARARKQVRSKLLIDIAYGRVRFNDEANGDGLQAAIDRCRGKRQAMTLGRLERIEKALSKARYDPGEGHDKEPDGLWPVMETIESMVTARVEEAWYPEGGDILLKGVA